MTDTVIETLTPILTNIFTIILSIIGMLVIALLNKVKDYISEKIGTETYNRAREVSVGLYTLLEDEFKGMTKAGSEKRAKMEQLLLEQFPTLTQTELDAINKEICATFKTEERQIQILEAYEEEEAEG